MFVIHVDIFNALVKLIDILKERMRKKQIGNKENEHRTEMEFHVIFCLK